MIGELQRAGWDPTTGDPPPCGYENMYIESAAGPVMRIQYCHECGDHTSLQHQPDRPAGDLAVGCCACGREFDPEVCT